MSNKKKDDKTNNSQANKSKTALLEEEVLKFWNENKIFEKSVEKPAGKEDPEEFTFYDGPPFATGTPHYGHLLQSFVKDAVPRYKTMRGYRVKRQWGWDCHGLPIENIVEKELGISGREDIQKIGVKKFNDLCRSKIFEYADVWKQVIPRIGRWADMENPYRTMDTDYMESEWWAFKELYKKGLIYEDFRSIHICPRCETTLSQSEVTEGYADIKDISVTVKFELEDEPGTYVLAWTTTPWTLPGNVALAVGKDIDYVTIEKADDESGSTARFILAKKRLKDIFADGEYKIVKEYKGSELIAKQYKPLFDYYYNDDSLKNRENGWKIYHADFISDDDGTGIAHEAPAFGAEDMELAKEVGLPFVQHVDITGRFKEEVKDFAGEQVKPKGDHQKTDVEIIKYLAHEGKLFDKKKIEHSYPHCWRCDTPLLNYATSSWFVKVEEQKDKILKNAEPINWSPKHIKNGRWGKWLEGARDWSISRNRFWANTMPVWRCDDDSCDNEVVMGSIDELEKHSGIRVNDLHKDVVDEVTWTCEKCGGTMRRIPDVLDTWFNSGSVPYATLHYPFENQDEFKKRMPADFIAEAQDQCRTWFYYQHVLSTSLFDSHAFKNVITTGMVLAEDGKKMSKKLKNYPDPMYMVDTYGADAIRLYILSSQVVRADNLAFSEKEVAELARKVFGRLVNVYEFYALYKDDLEHGDSSKSDNVLDRWIVARFQKLHSEVTDSMENYELDRATRGIGDFVDDLSTWYIRRSRDRLKGEDERDKKRALETTRFILRKFAKLIAPFTPFHADWLWARVKRDSDPESVHLSNWCSVKEADEDILKQMQKVREIVRLALDARKETGIKVRQPLAKLRIKLKDGESFEEGFASIIADEVNVKEVSFDNSLTSELELDTNISKDLEEEGIFREILRATQQARKEAGLSPQDKAVAKILATKKELEALEKYKEELEKQASLAGLETEESEELKVKLLSN